MQDLQRYPEIDVTVEQKPVAVTFECPECGHENRFDYPKFCDDNGQQPNWNIIRCQKCQRKFIIDKVEWD